jgi:hypothetical protein
MQTTTSSRGWHVDNWGTWGWIETILKGIAFAIGIGSFLSSDPNAPLTFGGHPELGAVIILVLMTLFTIVPLVLRFTQREIISMIFVIGNVLGHAGMLIALLRQPDLRMPVLAFAVFMVLGELSKQYFLRSTGYTEAGQSNSGMLGFSYGMLVIYTLLGLFILI